MEKLDRDLQKRVWQRVQSREEPVPTQTPSDNLKPLILAAQENAEAYRRIARKIGQRDSDRLMALHRESRQCVACLRGICRMRGEQVKVPRISGDPEPARRMMEKCYHRERKLWGECERRMTEGEHGVVFGQLASQARGRCAVIMELLGRMEG